MLQETVEVEMSDERTGPYARPLIRRNIYI